MAAKIDIDALKPWHLGVVCRYRRKALEDDTSRLNRHVYTPRSVEALLASGLLVAAPSDRDHFVLNPEVTDEQWDGVEVLNAMRFSHLPARAAADVVSSSNW